MGEASSLTQRHNAELIRLFLTFGSPDLPTKPPRTKLQNWLALLSKLDNPKAFHRTATLQGLYKSLLSHPDRNLQILALTCTLNYKSVHLIQYESRLRGLLDATKWREELTALDISSIEDKDRHEVIEVIIRLFFGMMLERHGRTKSKAKRASLLGTLGGCSEDELRILVDLMLEPFGLDASCTQVPENTNWADKQRAGFLNLLGDIVKRMGSRLVAYWPALLLVTIDCVGATQKRLEANPDKQEPQEDNEDEDEADAIVDEPQESFSNRAVRTLRQLAVKRFTDFFRIDIPFNFQPCLPAAFSAVVSPRLGLLEHENTQTPSALLELFHVWSSQEKFVQFLVDYDDRVLPKILACLTAASVKPAVMARIFDIVEHILALSVEYEVIANKVLEPHISLLLDTLAVKLPSGGPSSGELLPRQVSILSQVAEFTSSEAQARRILQHFTPLLKQPTKSIPEKTKVHLLKITQGIIPMVPDFRDPHSKTVVQTYEMISKLFQILRGKPARVALLDVFGQMRQSDPSLTQVYDLLVLLNAYSTKRVDEPDFERRLEGFSILNESLYDKLAIREWQPILYNTLQFIQDPEELAIRTNAAYTLRRFIDIVSTGDDPEVEEMFTRVLYPALKRGLLSKMELVRNEILGVLAYGIAKCDSIAALTELRPLQADGDKEADFFNNIHHIQIHRRTRALRRLSDYVTGGNVRSATIAELFLPLIGHIITNAPNMDHILVDVAITTTGALSSKLSWGSYSSLVKQYMNLVKAKTAAERACVRTVVAVLENFHFPMDDLVEDDEELEEKEAKDGEGDMPEELPEPTEATIKARNQTRKIADAVNSRLLPNLLKHLEGREENEDSLRIPVSVGIAKVACHLPQAFKEAQISRLLTILSQVFRSKSQDTRALARESLCKIAIIIGPSYLPKIMTELRAALLRGSHLHILATVAHALIVHVATGEGAKAFTDLDSCAADVAHVSAEVIFGQSGNDVRSEGFTTTVLEVKGSSSKGLDSFSILARSINPSHISVILSPIKGVMQETSTAKTLQLVEDVLRRVSSGLNANERINGPEYLSLCHTLVLQNARFLKEAPRFVSGKKKGKDFIVQTKRKVHAQENHYAHNSYRSADSPSSWYILINSLL